MHVICKLGNFGGVACRVGGPVSINKSLNLTHLWCHLAGHAIIF